MPTTRDRLWSAPGIAGRIRSISRRATASPSWCSCRSRVRGSGRSSPSNKAIGARVASATPACAERNGERMKKLELKPGSLTPAQALPLAGVLLLVLAGWQVWQGLKIQSANRLADATEAARTNLAQKLQPGIKDALDRVDSIRERAALAVALQRGDTEGA